MAYETYEAYEDNAGRLYIYALDGANPVWGQTYYGHDYEAAQDWGGLVVQGFDPVEERWEGIDPDKLAEVYYGSTARQIADSDLSGDDYPLGIMLSECGEAGKLFAIEAGAAYRCPECGEVLPTVRELNSWRVPRLCACCDASLTDHEI